MFCLGGLENVFQVDNRYKRSYDFIMLILVYFLNFL